MKPYTPSICFTPANIDACASWRMYYPKLYVPNSRFVFSESMPPLDDLAESDVVCVQRMMMVGNLKYLQTVRQCGIRIIYDLDDDLWDLPDSNPAKRWFSHPRAWRGLEACAEWADVITVSTKVLARLVSKKWEHLRNVVTKNRIPVMICENRTPLDLYQPVMPRRQDGIVVIGWGGSNTHAGDLAQMWPILHEILDKYPNVRLELIGHRAVGDLENHKSIRYREWCHISEYPGRFATWNWDIVLAPLEAHKFNMSKSSIKMQEAGAMHRPCLASNITPYSEFCRYYNELKWLLCTTSRQWKEKLIALIEQEELRNSLGELMYANVRDHFNIRQSVSEWRNVANAIFR